VEGIVFVISGPAGVGKTTLCDRMLGEFSETMKKVVTATTRKPRTGEVNGQDYHFLGKDEFFKQVDQGAFIEYECVHDNHYGTLKETSFLKSKIRIAVTFCLTLTSTEHLHSRNLLKSTNYFKGLSSVFSSILHQWSS